MHRDPPTSVFLDRRTRKLSSRVRSPAVRVRRRNHVLIWLLLCDVGLWMFPETTADGAKESCHSNGKPIGLMRVPEREGRSGRMFLKLGQRSWLSLLPRRL